jgi:hypothetical protein
MGVPRARPTMDIDLLRRGAGDQAALVRLVEECAAIADSSDGVIFEPTTISMEPIRDATEYVGTRIRLHARLDNVRQTVQIDFGLSSAADESSGAAERIPGGGRDCREISGHGSSRSAE